MSQYAPECQEEADYWQLHEEEPPQPYIEEEPIEE